jgi:hypothetical protein
MGDIIFCAKTWIYTFDIGIRGEYDIEIVVYENNGLCLDRH